MTKAAKQTKLTLQPTRERPLFTLSEAATIPAQSDHGNLCVIGARIQHDEWLVEVAVNQETGTPSRPDAIFDVRIFGGNVPQIAMQAGSFGVSFWCNPDELNQLAGMLLDAGKAARQLVTR